ncbi:MAG: segregation/condensation protein A [Calditrichaeota bacterium]|nr:segregation/condensation protein A [Calditrichota bacterium]
MYKIKLPVFEGPFDLLLYLIKKNEIDIYDIPIAEITRQYLEYIELMQMLDLEIAGEFIEMVATLMLIKTRMLLPAPPGEEESEPEDPRQALVEQLLEYKRFKEAAEHLRAREELHAREFPRDVRHLKQQFESASEPEPLMDATLFDLLTAMKRALDNMPKVTIHHVQTIKVTLEDQVEFILKKLEGKAYLLFDELVAPIREKIRLIVTFMALLDLMRLGMIRAKQTEIFGEIRLQPQGAMSMERYLQLRDQEVPLG